MKAIAINAFGDSSQFKLLDLPMPEPKENEVRLRIKASGFNPVDYKIREGHYGGGSFPLVLGSDAAGVIDKVGSGVKEYQAGDEVYALIFGQGSNGAYAEYVCIDTSFISHKPKNISFEEAAAIPLVGITAYRAVSSSGGIPKGLPVFIAGGSGGVGSLAVQMAKHFGADVFTTAGSEESATYISEYLNVKKENILLYKGLAVEEMKNKLLEMNKGELFAFAIDLIGGEMKKLCLEVAGFQGHVTSILPEEKGFPVDLLTRGESIAFQKSLSIHFIFVGSQSFYGDRLTWKAYKKELLYLKTLLEEGSLRMPTIQVVGDLSIETVKKAHQLLEEGHVKGKLIMKT